MIYRMGEWRQDGKARSVGTLVLFGDIQLCSDTYSIIDNVVQCGTKPFE